MTELSKQKETHLYYSIILLTGADIPACRRFNLLPCESDLATSIKGTEPVDVPV